MTARGGHVSGRGVYAFTDVSEEYMAKGGDKARCLLRSSIRQALEDEVGVPVGPIRFRFNPFERDLNLYAPPAAEGIYVVLGAAVAVPVAVQPDSLSVPRA